MSHGVMLKRPVRPRAPSAATLRLLYQLAYISSGTALGIGALCAEERRRRTQVVQKIADNAQRLRQHPRHRRNVTWAKVAGEERGYECVALLDGHRDGAILGPELPSVVDHGYKYTSERARKAADIRSRSSKETNSDAASTGTTFTATAKDRHLRRQHDIKSAEQIQRPKGKAQLLQQSYVPATTSVDLTTNTNSISTIRKPPLHLSEQVKQRNREPSTGTTHHLLRDPSETVRSAFQSQHHWRGVYKPSFWETLSSLKRRRLTKLVQDDIAHLFHLISNTSRSAITLDEADEISRALLRLTSNLGLLRDATSLFLWRIAVGRARDGDDALLAQAYLNFRATGRMWEPCVRRDDGQLQTQPHLNLARTVSPFEPAAHEPILTIASEESHLRWTHPATHFCTSVIERCRELRNVGLLGTAIYTMTALPLRDWTSNVKDLVQELFRAAMHNSQLPLCDRLLRWTGGYLSNDLISKADINAYIDTCGTTKAYSLLSAMFNDQSYRCDDNTRLLSDNKGWLSDSSILHLCYTFANGATRSQEHFSKCFEQLSDEQRKAFRLQQAEQTATNLSSTWTITRSFRAVSKQYDHSASQARFKADKELMRPLQLAMIRICLAAGKPQHAKDVFTAMGSSVDDPSVYLATMLTCAHAADWDGVDTVLNAVTPQTRGHGHISAVKQILQIYALRQDATCVQQICIRILDAFELAPDSSIVRIVLQQAVAEQRHDLFLSWFETCRVRGWAVNVDANLASALLRKYAVTVRPDHAMIMGTGHTLSTLAPGLYNERMRNTVRDAITYNIRHYRNWRTAWQMRNAKARLKHLESVSNCIPHPGVVWGKDLRLRRPYHNETGTILHLDKPVHDEQTSSEVFDETSQDVSQWSDQYETDAPLLEPSTRSSYDKSTDVELFNPLLKPASKPTNARQMSTDTVRSQMLLALTSHDYERVLSLYHDSCTADGLARSRLILEMALEASLCLHGSDSSEAHDLLTAAQSAGMNTATVISPLLMHRLQASSRFLESDVLAIKNDVLNYYRLNQQTSRQVSHHLAVTAANKLIKDGLPTHGISILENVFHSEWAETKSLDPIAIMVWIKAYVYTRNITGICDLVEHVLSTKMRMDQMLIWTLKLAQRCPWALINSSCNAFTEEEKETLEEYRQRCIDRRIEQKDQVSRYLPDLAFSLVKLWQQATYGIPAGQYAALVPLSRRRAAKKGMPSAGRYARALAGSRQTAVDKQPRQRHQSSAIKRRQAQSISLAVEHTGTQSEQLSAYSASAA